MPGPRPPLVQAVQLEKRYVDGPAVVHVLAGLDLEVEAGERLAIVGESGVGKSTFRHFLGGLYLPARGQVLFYGGGWVHGFAPDVAHFHKHPLRLGIRLASLTSAMSRYAL